MKAFIGPGLFISLVAIVLINILVKHDSVHIDYDMGQWSPHI